MQENVRKCWINNENYIGRRMKVNLQENDLKKMLIMIIPKNVMIKFTNLSLLRSPPSIYLPKSFALRSVITTYLLQFIFLLFGVRNT